MDETIDQRIARLEKLGMLDPECPTCQREFYPRYRAGKDAPFAPPHRSSSNCQSGKYPHCTCDTCF